MKRLPVLLAFALALPGCELILNPDRDIVLGGADGGGCPSLTCTIGGTVHCKGELNPAAPCQACLPETNDDGWSRLNDGTLCTEGGGVCIEGTCRSDRCFIDDGVRSAGEKNPVNPCEHCVPDSDRRYWTKVADETSCGGGGKCFDGLCQECGCARRQCGKDPCDAKNDCGVCTMPLVCSPAGQCVCEVPCGMECCDAATQVCGPSSVCMTGSEDTDLACSDGTDNDGNGLFDCDDPACCSGAVTVCTGGCSLPVCAAIDRRCGEVCCQKGAPCNAGSCGGVPVETSDADCGDGKDNDLDVMPDCEDSDCCSAPLCAGNCPAMPCISGVRCGATCCASGQACAAGVCTATTCNLFEQDCLAPTDGCFPTGAPGEVSCQPSGGGGEGTPCGGHSECARWNVCEDGACAPVCDPTDSTFCGARECVAGVDPSYGTCRCRPGEQFVSGTCQCDPAMDGCILGTACSTGSKRCEPANDSCATLKDPLVPGAGPLSGDLDSMTNDFLPGSACGADGLDQVFKLQVVAPAAVGLSLTNNSASPLNVTVLPACNTAAVAQTCFKAPAWSTTNWTLELSQNEVYVVVDGGGGGAHPYTLEAVSVTPPINDTCAHASYLGYDPTAVQEKGSTRGALPNEMGQCGGDGQDVAYYFRATMSASYRVTVKPDPMASPNFMPILHVREEKTMSFPNGCSSTEIACKPTVDGLAQAVLASTAEADFYLFVDGDAGDAGDFAMEVSRNNDQCSSPLMLAVDVETLGTTTGAAADYRSPAGCTASGGSHLGSEVVYAFIAPESKLYNVYLEPTEAWDPSIWITGDACGDSGACLGSANNNGDHEAEAANFTATLGKTYYIVVDSTMGGSAGAFKIKVH